MLDLLYGII